MGHNIFCLFKVLSMSCHRDEIRDGFQDWFQDGFQTVILWVRSDLVREADCLVSARAYLLQT
jgi:hypothetical protein